ncbi:MAG: hypothetical protein KJ058_08120 [Thermoanaerobaculia bacterium]|nr:hypothetical protein [Thermoanaerobaculia bacterium]
MRNARSRTVSRKLVPGLLVALLAAAPAAGEVVFGVRGGAYLDTSEPFAGLELVAPLGRSGWSFNPNLELVLVDRGDLVTANFDFLRRLPARAGFDLWTGVGAAAVRRDPGRGRDAETDPGLNLLVGGSMKARGFTPYAQLKLLLSDESDAVVAIGIRF